MDGRMSPFSSDQYWIQQYPNTTMPQSLAPDQPSADHTNHVQPSPKPIRRRSRASRRTPVTVLNATPTDFRALVQRFTGCDSKDNDALASSASAVNLPKGPVNIDFTRNIDHAADQSSSRYTYYDNQMIIRSGLQTEQVQPAVGGWSPGYGTENTSFIYESVDESSLMVPQSDADNHGYNI
ncbi:hypothetical protein QVD17_05205 [Tagetes erecta]|uniref:VQ domain-containing protein n=1 Tax=Tagetes erecta TaxID=13708 RepID=A0AAD8LH06_TARER|nr:hypothetical protein QVD17_05205 [Tagetes erecta]